MAQRIDTEIFDYPSTWLQPNSGGGTYTPEKYCAKTYQTIAYEKELEHMPQSIFAWGIDGRSSAGAMVSSRAYHSNMGIVNVYQNEVKQTKKTNVGMYFLSLPASSNISWRDMYSNVGYQKNQSYLGDMWIYNEKNSVYSNSTSSSIVWRGITVTSSKKVERYIHIDPTYLTGTSFSYYDYGWYLQNTLNALSYNYRAYLYQPTIRMMSPKDGGNTLHCNDIGAAFLNETATYISNHGNTPENWRVCGMVLCPAVGEDEARTNLNDSGSTAIGMPCVFPTVSLSDVPTSERFQKAYLTKQHTEAEAEPIPETIWIDEKPNNAITWGLGTSLTGDNVALFYSDTSSYYQFGVPFSDNFPTIYADRYTGSASTWIPTNENQPGFCCDAFYKMSTYQWDFDDVSYKWELSLAVDGVGFLDPGDAGALFPTANYKWWVVPTLKIIDQKGYSYLEAVSNALKHEIAFTGLPFVEGISKYNAAWTSSDVYLPVFDDHMITTGLYKTAFSEKSQLSNYFWRNVYISDDLAQHYDPNFQPQYDQDDRDFGDLSNNRRLRYGVNAQRQYVCAYQDIRSLQSYLNGTYLPSNPDFISDFKGTNPQDYIISLQVYPYKPPSGSLLTDIVIGPVNTHIQGYQLYTDEQWGGVPLVPLNNFIVYNFGTIAIPRYFGDFRDYQSKIIIQLPFIGSYELDPKLYIGQSIGLQYLVDYNTGSIAAEIKRNGLTLETHTGSIAATIPFFAANMGQYQNALASYQFAIEQNTIRQIGTALSFGTSLSGGIVAGGSPLAIGSGAAQTATSLAAQQTSRQELDYKIEHTAPSTASISTASPINAFFMDDRARLLIYRPKMLSRYNAAAYAHTVGHACCISGTLADFSGFTVVGSCDLSGLQTTVDGVTFTPTAQEINMIKSMLTSGIII